MRNLIKKILKESAGISFPVRKWSDIVYDEIMSNPQEKSRIIIDGYDYPEAFEEFQVDYFVIDYHPTITGYGHDYSGYDKDGNYVVLLYIQPTLVRGSHRYDLKTALNHELKHAYQDYKRITGGYPSIEHTKESKELYTGDFIHFLNNKSIGGPIKSVLKDYYYLSDLESTAYLENVYDLNPEYERIVRGVLQKNYDLLKNHPDLDADWYMVKQTYDIPYLKKFNKASEFIEKSDKILKNKAEKIIRKINKMKYIHGKG
jgi:hypothetical protein